MREVNKANLLNYESDDSEEDSADAVGMLDSDGLANSDDELNLKGQKEDLRVNNTWGKNKKSYY